MGRHETRIELAAPAPAQRLSALLDASDEWRVGDPLPPLWHWLYFLPDALQEQLGSDGHPRRGGFLPPVALPRRMFGGGRLTLHGSVRLGDTLEKTSTILSVRAKQGQTGDLVFVTVANSISAARVTLIEEEQDLVYLSAQPSPPAPGEPQDPPPAAWQRRIEPTPPLLFRFSALTFNAHRIHYDRPYATGVEGYPGLVVHGPLLATLLAELVRQHTDRAITSFTFRSRAPVFDNQPFTVTGAPGDDGTVALTAYDGWGRAAMNAEAIFGSI